jgi:hypothetical protein
MYVSEVDSSAAPSDNGQSVPLGWVQLIGAALNTWPGANITAARASADDRADLSFEFGGQRFRVEVTRLAPGAPSDAADGVSSAHHRPNWGQIESSRASRHPAMCAIGAKAQTA